MFARDPEGSRRAGHRGRPSGPDRARRSPTQAQPGDRFPHPDGTGVPRMTTTSRAPALAAPAPGDPASASAVAIISDAPVPHPTMVRTFAAMMAREFRVLGRNLPSTFVRSVVQPLLWVFVFTYVLPKIGAASFFEAGSVHPQASGAGRDHVLHHPAAGPDGLHAAHAGDHRDHVPAGHGVLLAAHDRGPGASPGPARGARFPEDRGRRGAGVRRRADRDPDRAVVHAAGQARTRT